MTRLNGRRAAGARSNLRLRSPRTRGTLITGGAGFIGANLADRLLSLGRPVTILDNCSRPGVERNLAWLRSRHGALLSVEIGDVRDAVGVRRVVAAADTVFHLAAQVAVTSSLLDPVSDFDVNARGTLNVLEAIRACTAPPAAIMTSTNKVYGALQDIRLSQTDSRYVPKDDSVRRRGISELRPLDLHSPYGCSKGSADQYVLDWSRSFGLRTAVFRMSCIYGPRQWGTEDQGWVAHFVLRALAGEPICIYGDGRQVRDLLFVDDLIDALLLASEHMDAVRGMAFNIGGGPSNSVSLIELLDLIARLHGVRPCVTWHDWRAGDQRYYVSDTSRFGSLTGWKPGVGVAEGVARLYQWLILNATPAELELAAVGASPARENRELGA